MSTLVSFFLNEADSMSSLKGEMVNPKSLPFLVILKSMDVSVETWWKKNQLCNSFDVNKLGPTKSRLEFHMDHS